MIRTKSAVNFGLISLFLISVSSPAKAGGISFGPKAQLGKGTARSFITEDKCGLPSSIGVEFTKDALFGLPDSEQELVLALPTGVNARPFEAIGLNWNPHGHEPTDIYGAPHFDFHFYTLPESVRHAMTCQGADAAVCMRMPEPDWIPSAYAPTPDAVPMMGWHWIDTLSPEYHGKPFTTTLIYGYYDGMVAFVEPMITRAFFLAGISKSLPIRVPARVGTDGRYPNSYEVKYSAKSETYRVLLRWSP